MLFELIGGVIIVVVLVTGIESLERSNSKHFRQMEARYQERLRKAKFYKNSELL